MISVNTDQTPPPVDKNNNQSVFFLYYFPANHVYGFILSGILNELEIE